MSEIGMEASLSALSELTVDAAERESGDCLPFNPPYEPGVGFSEALWAGLMRHNITCRFPSLVIGADTNIYRFSSERVLDRRNKHTDLRHATRTAALCSNAKTSYRYRYLHLAADANG